MTTIAGFSRADIVAATAAREARHGYPDRTRLERMSIKHLREYVEDCARDHGVQCVMVGQCYTSPAWTRFRLALDVLSKRGAP